MQSQSGIHCVIVTSWGNAFGMGHIQRMGYLSAYLSGQGISVSLLADSALPDDIITGSIITEMPGDATVIIRDKRDSTRAGIDALRKIAPVIVIDDLGEGREYADAAIDLLPNLKYGNPEKDFNDTPFLYGRRFADAVDRSAQDEYEKDIDLCIYAGSVPSDERVNFLTSIVPEHWKAVLCSGTKNIYIHDSNAGEPAPAYPESLLRSKILLTHYGITLFEGKLCGCALATLNPSGYHSSLSDLVRGYLGVVNLGIFEGSDPQRIKKCLKETTPAAQRINVGVIGRQVETQAALFFEKLAPYLK